MLEIYVIYLCVGFGHVYLVFIAIDFNNGELFIYLFMSIYLASIFISMIGDIILN